MPRTSKSTSKAKPKTKPKSKSPPIDPNAVTLGIHLLKYGNGRMQIDVTTEHTCVHAHLDKGLEAFDGIFKDMFKSLPMMGPVLAQVMGQGGPGAGAGGQGGPYEPCPGHDGGPYVQVPPEEKVRVDENGIDVRTGKPAKLTPKQKALLKAAARAHFKAQAAAARANLAMNPDQGTPAKAKAKPGRKRKAKGPKAAEAAQPVF